MIISEENFSTIFVSSIFFYLFRIFSLENKEKEKILSYILLLFFILFLTYLSNRIFDKIFQRFLDNLLREYFSTFSIVFSEKIKILEGDLDAVVRIRFRVFSKGHNSPVKTFSAVTHANTH